MCFDTECFADEHHRVKATPERISLAIVAVSEQCRRLTDEGDPRQQRDMCPVSPLWPVWFVTFYGSYRYCGGGECAIL